MFVPMAPPRGDRRDRLSVVDNAWPNRGASVRSEARPSSLQAYPLARGRRIRQLRDAAHHGRRWPQQAVRAEAREHPIDVARHPAQKFGRPWNNRRDPSRRRASGWGTPEGGERGPGAPETVTAPPALSTSSCRRCSAGRSARTASRARTRRKERVGGRGPGDGAEHDEWPTALPHCQSGESFSQANPGVAAIA